MNVLYVSHVSLTRSIYGAASSSRAHIRLFESDKSIKMEVVDQLLDRDIFKLSEYKISKNSRILPVLQLFEGRKAKSLLHDTFYFLRNFLGYISFCIFLIVRRSRYSVIHLGSSTLINLALIIRLVNPHVRVVLHVREVVDQNSVLTQKSLRYVNYIVFIDHYCQKKFLKLFKYNFGHAIATNPLIRNTGKRSIFLDRTIINIGLIGNFSDSSKGLENLSSICDIKSDFTLHIIGKVIDEKRFEEIRKMPNVKMIFHGEISDLYGSGFYEDLDYVVRLDKAYRVGRTVIEAVANGCKILAFENLTNEDEFENSLITFDQIKKENGILKKVKTANIDKNSDGIDKINREYFEKFQQIYNHFEP